jgi:hypothetical protein
VARVPSKTLPILRALYEVLKSKKYGALATGIGHKLDKFIWTPPWGTVVAGIRSRAATPAK